MPPSIIATAELVVPKSMPIILVVTFSLAIFTFNLINNKDLKLYYILDLKNFVNLFKIHLLTEKKNYEKELLNYISHNMGKPYTKEDIDYFLENRK